MQHGVRPYQSIIHNRLDNIKIGFLLTEERSGKKVDTSGNIVYGTNFKNGNKFPLFWGKENLGHYFFSKNRKIYSDKTAEFVFDANEKMKGEVISRISRIYPQIFLDEVQDLAGWDLEIVKLLFESDSNLILVGDPRQITYLTHQPKKNYERKEGKVYFLNILDYIEKHNLENLCLIDNKSLSSTHRNNKQICDFSAQLFPDYDKCNPCTCTKCRNYTQEHEGIFAIRNCDINAYCNQFKPVILRWSGAIFPEWNFGKSKGLTFDRVLIYPTKTGKNSMVGWLKNRNVILGHETRSKLYVALTRAKFSVGFIYDWTDEENVLNVIKWSPLS